jgi:biopolymer transport protein ExbD
MSSGGKRGPMQKMAHVGPNMTPMVDIVMCILIFFMLGSTFLAPELFLQSSMPAIDKQGLGQEQSSQKLPAVRMNIKLVRQGDDTFVSAFDWKPMKMDKVDDTDQSQNQQVVEGFVAKNQTLSPDVQIIIQPGANVPYQDVITIYDACVKAHFKQVAFAPPADDQPVEKK